MNSHPVKAMAPRFRPFGIRAHSVKGLPKSTSVRRQVPMVLVWVEAGEKSGSCPSFHDTEGDQPGKRSYEGLKAPQHAGAILRTGMLMGLVCWPLIIDNHTRCLFR